MLTEYTINKVTRLPDFDPEDPIWQKQERKVLHQPVRQTGKHNCPRHSQRTEGQGGIPPGCRT